MLCDADKGDYYAQGDIDLPLCQLYLDKMPERVVVADDWPSSGGCNAGWIQFGKGCFKVVGASSKDKDGKQDYKNPSFAEQYCASESFGSGHLAISKLKQYDNFIVALQKGVGHDSYIGLSAEGSSSNYDEFKWTDESLLTAPNWAPGEPKQKIESKRQVSVHWNGNNDQDGHRPGQWKDVIDDLSSPAGSSSFICSSPRSNSATTVPSEICPTGWFEFFGNCYKFISNPKSYDQHASDCESEWAGDKVLI